MSGGILLSSERFRYWAIDYERHECTVITADGQKHSRKLSSPPLPDNELASSVFDWENWWVISTTRRGDTIISEAYSPVSTDKGRPAIYLDQNHWSTVAWAMVDPSKVANKDELDAALRVVSLARDAGIVLPLSSAHFVETNPLYGDRRYNLGVAMAQLSGGWELRSPMAVWENEVAVKLAQHTGRPLPAFSQLPVVTTEPQAFLSGGTRAYETDSDWNLFQMVLSEPSITLSVLIDSDSEPKAPIPRWVDRNQQITEYFADAHLSPAERRRQAAGLFWMDNIDVLAKAALRVGADPLCVAQSVEPLLRQTESMPFVANLSSLFGLRYLDRQTRWKHNDFIDMMFLSCGAAYCDYVVAERHTGTQLRRAQERRGESSNVFVTLTAMVEALEKDGVKTSAERMST